MATRYSTSPDSSAEQAFEAVAPTAEFFGGRGVYVTGDGDVEVVPVGQTTSVTFVGALAGSILPISVKQVVSGSVVPLDTLGESEPVPVEYIIVDGEFIFVDGEQIIEA